MGNGLYEVYRNGEKIQAGYMVEAMCDKPDCTTLISRGLDALCGGTPGGDEYGCGGYFCDAHLYMSRQRDGFCCFPCQNRDTDPLDDSPDAMVMTFTADRTTEK
jgi:hypothetical protein